MEVNQLLVGTKQLVPGRSIDQLELVNLENICILKGVEAKAKLILIVE